MGPSRRVGTKPRTDSTHKRPSSFGHSESYDLAAAEWHERTTEWTKPTSIAAIDDG
jgi:hypothetical protein